MSAWTWPLFDLRIHCRDVNLRPVVEGDLGHLAAILPDDYEHDPRAEMLPWLNTQQNRSRLVYQGHWRSLGTWSPSSWCLDLAVDYQGAIVGIQSLEADNFPALRTVDSGSWLVKSVRGRGVGVSIRMAVLGLAFDHLNALAAVSSARSDNDASLGVSRRIGYTDNGVSRNDAGHGVVELKHMLLSAEGWRSSDLGQQVTVSGYESCRPWFGSRQ